jgi:hypothetical protein
MKPEDFLKTLGDKTLPTKLGEQAIEKQLIELPENGDKLQFSLGVESLTSVTVRSLARTIKP